MLTRTTWRAPYGRVLPRSRPRPPPEFLVDRSLGAFEVPNAVRALGYVVHRLRDLYPEDAQHADDVVWIAEAGAVRWPY